ncbi:MAG: toll/interleukin-1 receptor domain-containing protein [Rhodospirillales bacterium]
MDVFLSYAREDRATAERLARTLERHGRSVWWDRHVPAGKRFDEVIGENLASARCVVVLWSTAANASEWVGEEAEEARERGLLIPAMIEPVDPPLGFRRIQAADLVGWDGDDAHPGLQRLLVDIDAVLAASAASHPAPRPDQASPAGSDVSTPASCGPCRRRWAIAGLVGLAVVAIVTGLVWRFAAVPSASPGEVGSWIDGRWQGKVVYGWGGEYRETFEFRVIAGVLTGTAGFLGRPRAIDEGAVDGKGVRFVVRWTETDGKSEREAVNRYIGVLTAEGGLNMGLSISGGVAPHDSLTFALERE